MPVAVVGTWPPLDTGTLLSADVGPHEVQFVEAWPGSVEIEPWDPADPGKGASVFGHVLDVVGAFPPRCFGAVFLVRPEEVAEKRAAYGRKEPQS